MEANIRGIEDRSSSSSSRIQAPKDTQASPPGTPPSNPLPLPQHPLLSCLRHLSLQSPLYPMHAPLLFVPLISQEAVSFRLLVVGFGPEFRMQKVEVHLLEMVLGVGDLGVGLIAVKCKHIRYLDLSYLPITNKCLSSLLKSQHLEELVLEGCFGIKDDNLAVLKHGCKSLKSQWHLYPNKCLSGAEGLQQLTLAHGVTDEGLSSVVTKHKDIRKLDITCCRKITDVSIAHITNSCYSLTSLRMESCTLDSREAFVLSGQQCHLLEELDLTDNEIDDKGFEVHLQMF
ncbi:hypothetical protein CRYUN_Cryun09bG0002100 [Craigia yunnanensis]